DLDEGHHAAAVAPLDVEHRGQQRIARVDEVVTEQHRERLVADVRRTAQHSVAEPPGVALADVVNVGDDLRPLYPLQALLVALFLQGGLELPGAVEVVLDRVLVAPGDQEYVVQPGPGGLFHDVLDGRLVDDRQHLFRRGLGRREESRAQPRDRDHGLGHRTLVPCRARRLVAAHVRHLAAHVRHLTKQILPAEAHPRRFCPAPYGRDVPTSIPEAKTALRSRILARRAMLDASALATAAMEIRDAVLAAPEFTGIRLVTARVGGPG